MSIEITSASGLGTGPRPTKPHDPFDRVALVRKLRELDEEWRAFEDRLREQEHEMWQANWDCRAPLNERMSRLGYSQEIVDALRNHLATIYRFLRGEPASSEIQRDRDEVDAAECIAQEIAIKQLAAIVIAGATVQKQWKWPRHKYWVEASCSSEPLRFHGFIRFIG
jgi:hypothetical protein